MEAVQVTVRSIPEWRSKYFHLAMRRGRKIAKVAMARKLAVRLYWMWRKGWDYEQLKKTFPADLVSVKPEKIMIDNCQPRSLTFHDLKYGCTTLVLIFWTLEPAVHQGAPP